MPVMRACGRTPRKINPGFSLDTTNATLVSILKHVPELDEFRCHAQVNSSRATWQRHTLKNMLHGNTAPRLPTPGDPILRRQLALGSLDLFEDVFKEKYATETEVEIHIVDWYKQDTFVG